MRKFCDKLYRAGSGLTQATLLLRIALGLCTLLPVSALAQFRPSAYDSGPGLRVPPMQAAPPRLERSTPELENKADFKTVVNAQPKAYDYRQLSLFCKLEVQMEKALRLPVRFRVGDVQYVDWMEGKRRTAY